MCPIIFVHSVLGNVNRKKSSLDYQGAITCRANSSMDCNRLDEFLYRVFEETR